MTPHPPSPGLYYRMPAEWHPHRATWLAWPFGVETWFGEAHLAEVRREYAELVRHIALSEEVCLLVHDDEARASAQAHLGQQVHYFEHPLNDVWLRDIGPIFVTASPKFHPQAHPQPQTRSASAGAGAGAASAGMNIPLRSVGWLFNGWGRKFEHDLDAKVAESIADWTNTHSTYPRLVFEGGSIDVNGQGTALTTRQCLLNPNRNPDANSEQLEQALREHLGIEHLIWLEDGLEGDHTDGHIDTLARFVDARTVVTSVSHDRKDSNFAPMQRNLDILRSAVDAEGRPLHVVELPLPQNRYTDHEGQRLPATYANFYISNQHVLVPVYDDPHDQEALRVLAALFPTREVKGLRARAIIHGGGAFHCLTQQEPQVLSLPLGDSTGEVQTR